MGLCVKEEWLHPREARGAGRGGHAPDGGQRPPAPRETVKSPPAATAADARGPAADAPAHDLAAIAPSLVGEGE